MNKAHLTAISRKNPSRPMKWLFDNYGPLFQNRNCLDYGCGRGFDADYYGLKKFDPHYFMNPVMLLREKFDWVFCNYVLNVIYGKPEKIQVLKNINFLLKDNGGAFVTVRRDCPLGFTSKGTYQNPTVFLNTTSFHKTKDYETFFFAKSKNVEKLLIG